MVRLQREAQAAWRLAIRNNCTICDRGEVDRKTFFTLPQPHQGKVKPMMFYQALQP